MKGLEKISLLLICMTPFVGYAADKNGKHAIRGAGLIECDSFLSEQEKRSPAYLMMGGWIDGYITGVNQYAADTYDATSFESTELLVELIKNHCLKNPKDRLFPVINSILKQRSSARIKNQSRYVGIRLGEMTTQMYRETLVRIQKKLATRGFYELPASGAFDVGTINGLAAYQNTLDGYEATGFPDQATIWSLLSE
jgi:hypothetical protein